MFLKCFHLIWFRSMVCILGWDFWKETGSWEHYTQEFIAECTVRRWDFAGKIGLFGTWTGRMSLVPDSFFSMLPVCHSMRSFSFLPFFIVLFYFALALGSEFTSQLLPGRPLCSLPKTPVWMRSFSHYVFDSVNHGLNSLELWSK